MLTLTLVGGEAPAAGRQVNEWRGDRGRPFAKAYSDGRQHCIDWLGLAIFGFSEDSREVQVWPKPDVQQADVFDIFSRVVQPLILQALGWQLLHAGAVLAPVGAIAFCGRSGSGKSTLSFAMQSAGWRQIADDALLLRPVYNGLMARPLPFKQRLRSASRAYFAHGSDNIPLSPQIENGVVPLSTVYLLEQDASLNRPSISLVSRSRAFSELLANAESFFADDPHHTRQLVENYLELAARVAVFRLKYRPTFDGLPQLVREIVASVSGIEANSVCSQEKS